MSKEKQNNDLVNTLITVAESSSKTSTIPKSNRKNETVKEVVYRVLKENPYKFKQYELFYEVHINQLKKTKVLKLETYKLQRSELCSSLGWGFHGDEHGRIAIFPVESKEYKALFNDSTIRKMNAYNK